MAKASDESAGILYVVATPIGNLADLSPRAREILSAVEVIAAEDTRRSAKLLSGIESAPAAVSLHEHNEQARSEEILRQLKAGADVALISDAGTPLISDPGYGLVSKARSAGFRIVSIPGPSAVTAALSIAGLATDRFVFEGFLPRRKSHRQQRLGELASEPRTLVFFEAVHRIEAVVGDMARILGGARRAVIARELTKLHEQSVAGSLSELEAMLGDSIPLLGEFVVVVAGVTVEVTVDEDEIRRVHALLAADLAPSRAAAICARICGCSRNEVYALTRKS